MAALARDDGLILKGNWLHPVLQLPQDLSLLVYNTQSASYCKIHSTMSQTVLQPEILGPGAQSGGWMVVMFNNDHTSMDTVIAVLMAATGCDMQEAYIEMWEAHTFGNAKVHFAGKDECEAAATLISSAGIQTEVALEWPE